MTDRESDCLIRESSTNEIAITERRAHGRSVSAEAGIEIKGPRGPNRRCHEPLVSIDRTCDVERSKRQRATKGALMTSTETRSSDVAAGRVIESIADAENSALRAVQQFVEDINRIFPDVNDDGPRQKIIDSAFNMTREVLEASNRLAQRIVNVTEDALGDPRESPPSK